VNVRRILRGAAAAAILSCGVLAATSVSAVPAFADGTTGTVLTVTPTLSTITTGKAISFGAAITPSIVGKTKITGTVDWTVTGADGTVVPCSTVKPLTGGGKARCSIANGILLAKDAPFTVVASYSGDANFGPSTGSTQFTVTPAKTIIKVTLDAPPSGGSPTTATAVIKGGPATPLIDGTVVFTISSSRPGGASPHCTGTAKPPLANNIQPVVAQTATCTIPAGWVTVANPTPTNKHPFTAWSVSAVYNGNDSFTPSFATRKGIAKS
jgi:hypothetical protein